MKKTKNKEQATKHKMSKGELIVKIIAGIMALIMIGSICISVVYYFIYFFGRD